MSQVTITDIKDVITMPEEEILSWIAAHRADPKDHRYAAAVWDDLDVLEAELARRAATKATYNPPPAPPFNAYDEDRHLHS